MKNYALSPLIENLTMMTSSKWKKCHLSCRKLSQLQHIKIWEKLITGIFLSEITSIERRTLWRHQWKLNSFELRCKYDDFLSLCRRHGGMESYLQLMLFPTMKNWGSCTIHRNWCRSSIGWGVICDLELDNFLFLFQIWGRPTRKRRALLGRFLVGLLSKLKSLNVHNIGF